MIKRIYPNINTIDDNLVDALSSCYLSYNAKSIKNTTDVKPEMIVKLKGNIEQFDQNFLDLDVNGTVYRILMSNRNIETWSNKDRK